MKKLLLSIGVLVFCFNLLAQNEERGVKSIIELNGALGMGEAKNSYGVNPNYTFGYQFLPYLFGGVGVGYNLSIPKEGDLGHSGWGFLQARAMYPYSSVKPFTDFKIGYSNNFANNKGGMQYAIGFGAKFNKFYLALGYGFSNSTYETTKTVKDGGYWKTVAGKKYWVDNYKKVSEDHTKTVGNLILSLGFEL